MVRVARALAALAALATTAVSVSAQQVEPQAEVPAGTPNVTLTPRFVDTAHSLSGSPVIVNAKRQTVQVRIDNNDDDGFEVAAIGGQLIHKEEPMILANVTMIEFRHFLAPHSADIFNYQFTMDLQPDDYRLRLIAVMRKGEKLYTGTIFDEIISVTDPDVSLFDVEVIFMYALLLALGVGTVYLIYSVWFGAANAKKRKPSPATSAAVRSKTTSRSSSSAAVDEAWLPASTRNRKQ